MRPCLWAYAVDALSFLKLKGGTEISQAPLPAEQVQSPHCQRPSRRAVLCGVEPACIHTAPTVHGLRSGRTFSCTACGLHKCLITCMYLAASFGF